jgi:hypothetical protein
VIVTGQGTAVAGSATYLTTLPAGPCCLLLSNAGTASPVYIGQSGGTAGTTTGNGFPVPAGQVPVAIPGYLGAGPARLYAITASGQASIGWLLSTATGGTGL